MPHVDGTEIIDKVHSFKAGKPYVKRKDLNKAISEID